MPISINEFVQVTSGVTGTAAVAARQFFGRLVTQSPLVPVNTTLSFTNSADVVALFGADSEEGKMGLFYFSFISKSISQPRELSYTRWNEVAVAPTIIGTTHGDLAELQAIVNGTMTITIGTDTNVIASVDFSLAADLAGVATIMETAIQVDVSAPFATATVVFDAQLDSFIFTGGVVGDAVITIDTPETPLAISIGWTLSAIISDGNDIQTAVEAIIESSVLSDNFGSFHYVDVVPGTNILTEDDATAISLWNSGENFKYIFCMPTTEATYASLFAAIGGIAGTAMTLSPLGDEYPGMVPMMVFAATNFEALASVQNYMFQFVGGLTSSVTTTEDFKKFNESRVNFYGNTQTGGQIISFYMSGFLTGTEAAGAAVDMGVYANEVWLKAAFIADIMSLLLASGSVPASIIGEGSVLAVMQPIIDQALANGTISAGKELTAAQAAKVFDLSGDPAAPAQVATTGYWVDAKIESYVEDSVTKFKVVYTLIYSKNDSIRKVEGTDILI
jgi:hypothetical protein